MMLVTPAAYLALQPLFADMQNHLPIVAALRGDIEADVYADDPARPRVALVDVRHCRLYLAGQAGDRTVDTCAHLLTEVIYPSALAGGVPVFSLCVAPGGWEAHMNALLGGRSFQRTERQYYEFDTAQPPRDASVPAGYGLREADAALLAEAGLADLDALREEMTSERASVEEFLARSFGVCPVTADALVGWCLSEYNTGDRCEVGIATLPPHQGKGLATATGSAFIQQALARGITRVGWHCYAMNRPSWATALKIGFTKVEDYPAYLVWCTDENAA